jgi:hypothetical protein
MADNVIETYIITEDYFKKMAKGEAKQYNKKSV